MKLTMKQLSHASGIAAEAVKLQTVLEAVRLKPDDEPVTWAEVCGISIAVPYSMLRAELARLIKRDEQWLEELDIDLVHTES